jgi:hypothetical protein
MQPTAFPRSSAPPSPALLLEQKLRVEARARTGADWFYWMAGLSVLSSLAVLANYDWARVFVLGAAQLFEHIVPGAGLLGKGLTLLVNAALAAIFVGFGLYARRGLPRAFLAGMFLYAVDGLLSLLVRTWFSVFFHVLVLLLVYSGLVAASRLQELNRSSISV